MTLHALLKPLKLTIALVAFTTFNLHAQVHELFSGFDFTNVQPGDSFAVEIINTGNDAITFYPLTVFDSTANYLFLDEQYYDTYLNAPGNQPDAIRAHARIVKSPYFINGRIPASEFAGGPFNQQLAGKKYAFPQWFLTSCNYQCGEYWAMGSNILSHFSIFDNDSIWKLSIPGTHTLGEGIINGDTALIDFDPTMPRLLDTLPDGSFISAMDVYLNPEYLDTQNPYNICDINDSCRSTEVPTAYYAGFFNDTITFNRYADNTFVSQNMPGTWTLCAGCSMLFEFKIPAYVVDLNDSTKRMLMDSVIFYLVNQVTDSIILGNALQQLLGTASKQEAMQVFNQFDFIYAHQLSDPLHSYSFGRNALTFKLKIPGRASGYSFSDIQMPLAIRDIVSDSGLVVSNNNISAGQHHYKLWDEGGILDAEANFTVPDAEYNYVKDVAVTAFNTVEMDVYYNQLLYSFFKGFKAEFFSASPTFTINTYPQVITTDKATFSINAQNIVYPNPAQHVLHVAEKGILTNALGNRVMSLQKGANQISTLEAGIYFFSSGNHTQKVVKY